MVKVGLARKRFRGRHPGDRDVEVALAGRRPNGYKCPVCKVELRQWPAPDDPCPNCGQLRRFETRTVRECRKAWLASMERER